jgi:hypothetical protein
MSSLVACRLLAARLAIAPPPVIAHLSTFGGELRAIYGTPHRCGHGLVSAQGSRAPGCRGQRHRWKLGTSGSSRRSARRGEGSWLGGRPGFAYADCRLRALEPAPCSRRQTRDPAIDRRLSKSPHPVRVGSGLHPTRRPSRSPTISEQDVRSRNWRDLALACRCGRSVGDADGYPWKGGSPVADRPSHGATVWVLARVGLVD